MIQTITRRHICFVAIVESELLTPERQRCEAALFARLSNARVAISMVAVHDDSCAFAVDEHDLPDLRKAIETLIETPNVTLSVRTRCARVTLAGYKTGSIRDLVGRVIAAIADEGIVTVHVSAGTAEAPSSLPIGMLREPKRRFQSA